MTTGDLSSHLVNDWEGIKSDDAAPFATVEAILLESYRLIRRVHYGCKRGMGDVPQLTGQEDTRMDDSDSVEPGTLRAKDMLALLRFARRRQEALIAENALWRVWTSTDRGDVAALFREGVACLLRGNHSRAKEFFKHVLEIDPTNAEAANKLAALYSNDHDPVECSRWAELALTFNPNHFGAHTGMGLALEQQGDKEGAEAAFRKALLNHPWAANVPTILTGLVYKSEEEANKEEMGRDDGASS